MEYQKIINLWDNTPSQPTKFRRKIGLKKNDDTRQTYRTNSQIELKTSMLKSSLCDYSDEYRIVIGTITVSELKAGGGSNGINAIFKNSVPFIDCTSEINHTQIDNAKDIDVVMLMYNRIQR